jgi:flap endonuclease-1
MNLKLLGISREQLIDIAILVGTDYNDGVKGVGPKTALKLIKKHGNIENIEKESNKNYDFPYAEIREIFLSPPKSDLSEPKWTDPQEDELKRILCAEHDFSANRIERSLERLQEALEELRGSTQQSSLTDFF